MSGFAALRSVRPALWALALVGLVGINGPFLYYALLRPDVFAAAQRNPVALVFMAEAFVLVAFGAWAIARLGLRRPGWLAFVALSVVGSLAFSAPAFVLWHLRKRGRGGAGPATRGG